MEEIVFVVSCHFPSNIASHDPIEALSFLPSHPPPHHAVGNDEATRFGVGVFEIVIEIPFSFQTTSTTPAF